MSVSFKNRSSKRENISEITDASVKAAIMKLKEDRVLGWVQDQLDRKASPHGIMDELSAAHTFDAFRDEFFFPSALIDRGTRREFEEKGSKDTYAKNFGTESLPVM